MAAAALRGLANLSGADISFCPQHMTQCLSYTSTPVTTSKEKRKGRRAGSALPEGLGLSPSTFMVSHNSNASARGL